MQVQEVTKMATIPQTKPEAEKADALTITDHRTGRGYRARCAKRRSLTQNSVNYFHRIK